MKALLLACLLAPPAAAQQRLQTRRGDLPVRIHVQGTVVASELIRLKAEIDGRVEQVTKSTYGWIVDGKPLAFLANREMAAIHDSHTTTIQGVVEERWRKIYSPTPVRCPADCFVLRVFAKDKEWLKPKALLVEAALKVQLVGRVRPEDAHWIQEGQTLQFWDPRNPERKLRGRVSQYALDQADGRVAPGGTLAVDLSPRLTLDPGTNWEGLLIPEVRRDVILVPTAALISHQGETYLAVRVTTGVTTAAITEIEAGVEEGRRILMLDDAALKGAARHKEQPDAAALRRRMELEYQRHLDAPPEQQDAPQVIEPRRRRQRRQERMPDPDATYSESPYSE